MERQCFRLEVEIKLGANLRGRSVEGRVRSRRGGGRGEPCAAGSSGSGDARRRSTGRLGVATGSETRGPSSGTAARTSRRSQPPARAARYGRSNCPRPSRPCLQYQIPQTSQLRAATLCTPPRGPRSAPGPPRGATRRAARAWCPRVQTVARHRPENTPPQAAAARAPAMVPAVASYLQGEARPRKRKNVT